MRETHSWPQQWQSWPQGTQWHHYQPCIDISQLVLWWLTWASQFHLYERCWRLIGSSRLDWLQDWLRWSGTWAQHFLIRLRLHSQIQSAGAALQREFQLIVIKNQQGKSKKLVFVNAVFFLVYPLFQNEVWTHSILQGAKLLQTWNSKHLLRSIDISSAVLFIYNFLSREFRFVLYR